MPFLIIIGLETVIALKTMAIFTPILAFLIGGLISYIFRVKDKSEDNTTAALKNIQVILNSVNVSVNIMQKEVENTLYDMRALQRKEEASKLTLHKIELSLSKIETLATQLELRIKLIEDKK